MSTPPPNAVPLPNPMEATRFPSMSTKVSLGSKPRRLGITLPSPPLAMFWLTVAPASAGSLLSRSVALRTPNFSMSS